MLYAAGFLIRDSRFIIQAAEVVIRDSCLANQAT